MFELLQSWLHHQMVIWGFGGLAALGLLGLAVWVFGLGSVLRILATLLDIISPILKGIAQGAVDALSWLWTTVVWPGVKDICDNWATLALVAMLTLLPYWYLGHVVTDRTEIVHILRQCQGDLRVERSKRPKTVTKWRTTKPKAVPFWPWE